MSHKWLPLRASLASGKGGGLVRKQTQMRRWTRKRPIKPKDTGEMPGLLRFKWCEGQKAIQGVGQRVARGAGSMLGGELNSHGIEKQRTKVSELQNGLSSFIPGLTDQKHLESKETSGRKILSKRNMTFFLTDQEKVTHSLVFLFYFRLIYFYVCECLACTYVCVCV